MMSVVDGTCMSRHYSLHLSLLDALFFVYTATSQIYTLSLHDALPIFGTGGVGTRAGLGATRWAGVDAGRSEEHTSELQSLTNLVCRLLLEKKKSELKSLTKTVGRSLLETNQRQPRHRLYTTYRYPLPS